MMRDHQLTSDRKVTVDREKLLETLKTNREQHVKNYQEAVIGYKEMATDRLNALKDKAFGKIHENFDRVAAKIQKFDPNDEEPLDDVIVLIQSMAFNLKIPQDHSSSYDVAIQMAEWEVNETIELTQAQFQCFVMDDWDWKDEFDRVSFTYSNYKK